LSGGAARRLSVASSILSISDSTRAISRNISGVSVAAVGSCARVIAALPLAAFGSRGCATIGAAPLAVTAAMIASFHILGFHVSIMAFSPA
jgi:hypothetical protein